ncbi:hypothetical protein [Streptomyces sp. NPDC002855]|uniref:hypothetical protein n=1 Tax=Streptomyces sp. NPDC002855 TaxID=3154437 RepID=UPI00332D97E2
MATLALVIARQRNRGSYMVNRPKAKGTAAETAVVRWLVSMGWTDARRNVLAGRDDDGDIDPIPVDPPPIIISVKNGYGGRACVTCNHIRPVNTSTAQFQEWWAELGKVADRRNPNALTLLVVKRAGKTDPEYWHWFAHSGHFSTNQTLGVVEITGKQAKTIMRAYVARYGV